MGAHRPWSAGPAQGRRPFNSAAALADMCPAARAERWRRGHNSCRSRHLPGSARRTPRGARTGRRGRSAAGAVLNTTSVFTPAGADRRSSPTPTRRVVYVPAVRGGRGDSAGGSPLTRSISLSARGLDGSLVLHALGSGADASSPTCTASCPGGGLAPDGAGWIALSGPASSCRCALLLAPVPAAATWRNNRTQSPSRGTTAVLRLARFSSLSGPGRRYAVRLAAAAPV